MKLALPALILGFGLLAAPSQASPREGTFDDPNATVPTRQVKAAKRRAAPLRLHIAPSADRAFRRRLHDLSP